MRQRQLKSSGYGLSPQFLIPIIYATVLYIDLYTVQLYTYKNYQGVVNRGSHNLAIESPAPPAAPEMFVLGIPNGGCWHSNVPIP